MSSSRSHHVHPDRLPIVQKAFELRYTSQSKFGEDVPCTRSTVFNFLKGKNVERYILKRCCELLGLEVETIVSPINSNPPVELESVLAEEPPSDGEGVVPSQVIPKNLAAPLLTPNTHEEIRWVGRESLVQDLLDRLSQDCRVLMLVGMTGIGKTSLGVKLRDDLRSQFPNPIDISFDTDQPSFNQILKAIFGKTVTPLGTDPRPSDALLPDLIHHLQTGAFYGWGGRQFSTHFNGFLILARNLFAGGFGCKTIVLKCLQNNRHLARS